MRPRHDRFALALALGAVTCAATGIGIVTAGIAVSTAVLAADAQVHDPELEAAKRRFGAGTQPAPPTTRSAPAPPASATSAPPAAQPALTSPAPRAGRGPSAANLQAEFAEVLKDEPVLDAAASAALARQQLHRVDAAADAALAGYDPNALPNRLRHSEAAVEAVLRRLRPHPAPQRKPEPSPPGHLPPDPPQ